MFFFSSILLHRASHILINVRQNAVGVWRQRPHRFNFKLFGIGNLVRSVWLCDNFTCGNAQLLSLQYWWLVRQSRQRRRWRHIHILEYLEYGYGYEYECKSIFVRSACAENDRNFGYIFISLYCSIWAHRNGAVYCVSLHWELNREAWKESSQDAQLLRRSFVRALYAACRWMAKYAKYVCAATVLCHLPHMTAFGYAPGRCIAASEIGWRRKSIKNTNIRMRELNFMDMLDVRAEEPYLITDQRRRQCWATGDYSSKRTICCESRPKLYFVFLLISAIAAETRCRMDCCDKCKARGSNAKCSTKQEKRKRESDLCTPGSVA